jgi:hypothetical protein
MNCLKSSVTQQLRKNTYAFSTNRNENSFQLTGEMWGEKGGEKGKVKPTPENDFGVPPLKINKRDPDEVIEEAKKERERKVEEGRTKWQEDEKERLAAAASMELNGSTAMPSKMKPLIDFRNKVYIAPLTTVGNLPFRRIMKNFGADITCAEMCLASNLLQGQVSEAALLKRHHTEDVFGVQLAGGFSDQWARAAELIEQECPDVDFIDMNCGCPLDIVCDKGAGSAMMNKPNKMKNAIIAMANKFSGPITVKMRTGWDEKKPFADTLTAKIQSWELPNVAAMMVHGRSRLQRYSKVRVASEAARVASEAARVASEAARQWRAKWRAKRVVGKGNDLCVGLVDMKFRALLLTPFAPYRDPHLTPPHSSPTGTTLERSRRTSTPTPRQTGSGGSPSSGTATSCRGETSR